MRSVESSILLLLLSFLLCWSPSSAQQQQRMKPPPQVVGGYSPAKDLEDETVVEAAEFALTVLLSSLNKKKLAYSFVPTSACKPIILEASQQVVAGLNIQMTILLVDEDYEENSSCVGAFAVTVYNRFGDLSVTGWGREYTCEEAMLMMEATESSSSEE